MKAARCVFWMDDATAQAMVLGCVVLIVSAWERMARERAPSLEREVRRLSSEGERWDWMLAVVGSGLADDGEARSGEGCPFRARRSSWSIFETGRNRVGDAEGNEWRDRSCRLNESALLISSAWIEASITQR